MRPRALLQQLRAIEDIRAIQHRAAEIEAMRSASAAETSGRVLAGRLDDLAAAQTGWLQALAGGSLGAPIAQAWSAAIRSGLEASAEAKVRAESSRAASAEAEKRWQEAGARQRLALNVVKRAARRLEARLQSDRDAEMTDLHLIRRGRS